MRGSAEGNHMATDHQWVAVERVIRQALFDDVDVVANPPKTSQEWESLAETISDHVCAAFETKARAS